MSNDTLYQFSPATEAEVKEFDRLLNPERVEVKTSSHPLTWECECGRTVSDPRNGCSCGDVRCLPSGMRLV